VARSKIKIIVTSAYQITEAQPKMDHMTADTPRVSRAVPAIWGNVPQRNKNFTGRGEIFERLRHETSKVTAVLPEDPLPQALQGLGGVGKTAVAIEYAHRFRSEYELVWWIPADELALIRSSLAALAGRLGLESATATGIESAASAVLDALRRGYPFNRWLLIFDNADQPEELQELIPHGPGDVLITSRNHRWQSVVDTVQVDVFARTESAAFLAKRVPRGITESDADRLADKLGDLPLALEQAGALQAETGMSVDEYLRLLDEHASDIMAEGKSPEYPRSMTAAWKLSVATVRQQLPEAEELLRYCAFFGSDPIPREVLRRGTQMTETRVSDLIANPILFARAIRELGRFALLKIDGGAILIHRLIQALIRDDLSVKEKEKYRHEVHLILTAGAPTSPEDRRQWPFYAELIAHAASPVTSLERCQDPDVRAFALDMVRYLYRSGDLLSSKSFAQRFAKQWKEDSGSTHPTVLDAQRLLGNAHRELGEFPEAYRIIEETLSDSQIVLGPLDPLTLALRNAHGADLRAHGDFKNARELDLETLDIHLRVFGEDDPQTWRVMSNLALDHGLNSDYQAAREMHQRAYLLQRQATSGVSATEVLNSWSGIARALRLCGNFFEARDVGEDARDHGRDELGPEHYLTLRATTDLSIALRRIPAAHDEALQLAQDVLDLSVRLFGEKHPDTMAAAISLTNIQRVIGQTDQALILAERTLASYPDVYGPYHPYNYGCAGNLALLRRLTGDPNEARKLNEAALAGLDAKLGRDHFYSLTVAINLASDFAAIGEPAKARELGQDSLLRCRSLLGEQNPLTLSCAANLVVDLRTLGIKAEEVDRLLEETLNHYANTLGVDHSEAIAAAAGLRLEPDFDPPPI
jgi:tetratricopeptide (TPR) repeat protein